jgi:hypothetical protein
MIVGLCGYGRSGKDTVAQRLVEHGWGHYAFADGVRELVELIDPWVPGLSDQGFPLHTLLNAVGWEGSKDTWPEVRRLLQETGTRCREVFGPTVWVDLLSRRIGREERHVVVSDVRFPNEARWVQNLGGKVLWVERPGVGPANDHPSETGMDDYPVNGVINNGGTVDDLRREADKLHEAFAGIALW